MKRLALLAVAFLLAPFVFAADEPAPKPADAPRVLIVSIDGLRPDMALRAKTPTIHALMEQGSFSFWARTTPLAITLPSHTSMLTGVIPRKHEIEWNKDLPLKEPVYPMFPTLFEVAHKHGYTTGMAAGKSKFTTLAKPGTLDWQWIAEQTKSEDPDVADHAVAIIKEHQPQVMFVHFPSTDNVGHAKGWGTHEQLETVGKADEQLARVLAALDEVKLRDKTFIIVTADHGGAGRTHVPDDARARHIPWIAVGPNVRKDLDLTTFDALVINTEDTFATASYVLKLPLDKRLDGKPIKEIFEKGELLEAK
jgi:predicted AlkP superfamily pyrophosphatase or phosphodiesterase